VASERPGVTEVLPTIELGLPGWRLRAWREGDAPALSTHADNVNVWRWMSDGFPHPYTLAIAEHWVRDGHVDFGGDNWAIACGDEAVGGCGIHPGTAQFRCNAEVGWWLAEVHWGRGVVTRVAAALVERAFAEPQEVCDSGTPPWPASRQAAPGRGDFWGDEKRSFGVGARSALRALTCRIVFERRERSERSELSGTTPRRASQCSRRSRPPRHEPLPGAACRDACKFAEELRT